MSIVFKITAFLAIIVLALMICLMVIGFISFDQGLTYLLKTLLVIIVLGAASAVIAVIMGNNNAPDDKNP